ncbi:hypothetical protein ACSVC9_13920 [Clostridium sp. LBM24168]
MKPILYANAYSDKMYSSKSVVTRIKDRFKIRVKRKYFIKDLDLTITNIVLPPNINEISYRNNLLRAEKKCRCKNLKLAPKIYRHLDYNFYNNFQRKLMAYSICKSTQMVLRNMKKNIRSSCIVIYDAADDILFNTICFFAKHAKFIVLLSENMHKINKIMEYIIANYGISPVVTSDQKFSFEIADFIITSKDIIFNKNSCVWYVCNSPMEVYKDVININDVNYKIPWNFEKGEMCFEILGSILGQMDEKDIEKSLKYNGVFLNDIKYNEDIINL